jgi:Zn-dependent protease
MSHTIQQIVLWAPPILIAIILHEVAHGFVAHRLGDPTAAQRGRLTLNPLPHVDPVGTVALPLFLVVLGSPYVFGWAKPVPVNFRNLRNPKRDMVKVALAGPLTNACLALVSAALLHALMRTENGALVMGPLARMSLYSLEINVVLAVFNLIPILPLDGGRVLTGLLPRPQAIAFSRLEPYGLLIVMALLFTGTLGQLVGPVVSFMLHALL